MAMSFSVTVFKVAFSIKSISDIHFLASPVSLVKNLERTYDWWQVIISGILFKATWTSHQRALLSAGSPGKTGMELIMTSIFLLGTQQQRYLNVVGG